MLPKDRDENEDGSDEDDGQGDLRDGTGGERLDLALRSFRVFFLVPSRESSEEEQTDEGENDGNDAKGPCQQRTYAHPAINRDTHIKYGNTIMSLNWAASQMRLRGSWSTETSLARAVALLLHSHEPPSGLTQMPK